MIENLTPEQRDTMLRFLLHRVDTTTRVALMTELPIAYVTLHPESAKSVKSFVLQAIHDAGEK